MTTFDIHLDIRVEDTDGHEYKISDAETGSENLYIIIEPDPDVYLHTRMDDGPRPEHVDVYKAALIAHDGDVEEALRDLYVYLMNPTPTD